MAKGLLAILFVFVTVTGFTQNYTILGNSSAVGGCNCFELTPDAGDQAGAIFQNNTIDLTNSFDYTFNVFLGCNGANGADGICFVLTTNPNGLGNPGEGLGYAGSNQPFSLAVEFDTWQNGAPANDPAYDHIGIHSGGQYNHNVAPAVPALASQANIDDCNWHTVRIVWDAASGTFSVYFDGALRQNVVLGNITNSYFGGNPIVNWGWSGATGGGTNEQAVCVLSTSSWVAGVNYQTCNPTVQFQDVSTSNVGNVQGWAWTFGDGGTSTQQNPTHTYAAPGNYTVTLTITDITGCTTNYSHDIVINPPITLAPTLVPPPCNGGSNGSIDLVPSGGFGPSAGMGGYAFTWNDGHLGATYAGVPAGTYTVTVTDGVCTSTGSYTLNQPTPLTASVSSTAASCGANNGTASIVISGGTTPYTAVTWVPGGLTGTTITGLAPALYTADFHDANGCSALLMYQTQVASLPCGYTATASSVDVSCFGLTNGSATFNVTGYVNPPNWSWSNGGTTSTISNLAAGTYTCTFTDGAGVTATTSVAVNQPGAAMVASLATVDMSCASSNDGQAIASVVSGGVPNYSYAWSGGQPNNPVANGLSAGAVTVTVTDSKGCTATASGNITGPPTLTLNVTAINDSCYQSHKGSATANVAGGNPPYTYYWSNISSGQTNLSLTAGTYTVTVTDDKGCTITGSATITQPPLFTHTIASQNINCFGNTTGSITLTPNGGVPAYTYTWNPGSVSGNAPTNLAAGGYGVTIEDANHCTQTDTVTITQPASALTVTSSHVNVTCHGLNNGMLIVNISGGTPPYFYQGNPIPAGSDTLFNLAPNTYAGAITDNNGCSVNISETITEPGVQSLSLTQNNNTCNGGHAGDATANFVNATGSVTYNWSNGGNTATINSLQANTYTVTATDANACSFTGSITITDPAPVTMNVAVTNAACFGANGSATAQPVAGTAPFTYTWSASPATTATVSLPAGTNYTVTSVDAAFCNQTATFSITEPAGMNVQETHTDVNCYGDSTGTITLNVSGGTGPNYTYAWSPNVATGNIASMLKAGSYTITVTDQATCTSTITVNITEPSQALTLNVAPTNITCFGQNNGSITLNVTGGTPGYTYGWSPNVSSGSSATGLSAGSYTITITDTKGCSVVPSITISEPSQPLTLATAQTNLTCYQSANGVASVSVSGGTFPYTYAWSPNVSTTNSASGLAAGSYTVTVTDNNGCTNSSNFNLAEPAELTASETHVDVLCNGDATGSITITANGGTPGYTYTWNPNIASTNAATGLTAGTYAVTVSDANGCSVLSGATITEPGALSITLSATAANCYGESTGTITAQASGGVSPYGFSASNDGINFISSSTGQFTGLAAGNYTVLMVDQNTCTASGTVTVTEPTQLVNVTGVEDASCYHYADGVLNFGTTGGNPGYLFALSNGTSNSTGSFGGLAEGSYQVTITDSKGCSIVDSGTIHQPDTVLISVLPNPTEVELGSSLDLTSTTNQSGNVTYEWFPAFGLSCYDCANPTFNGVYSQIYVVRAVTDSGCVGSDTLQVTVIPNYNLFIPNAFTPNGDGTNDYWQIFGKLSGVKQIEVQVFNRIGEKVFESHDLDFKWDGTYKGKDSPNGVYVYQLKIVWIDNHSDNGYKGSLTLLR